MIEKVWTRDFTLLVVSNFLMCCAYYSLISTLPVYISSNLHAANSVVGLVMACYTIAAVLIRPAVGFGLDRLGRRTILLLSLILYALIFNIYLLAISVFILTLVRFAHGLTWGMTTTSNSTFAGDIIPGRKRGEGFGYFGISTTLGMAIGPLIGSFILQYGGFNAMFISGSLISIVSMACAAGIRYSDYRIKTRTARFTWRHALEPTAIIPSLNLIVIIFTYGGLLSFVTLYGRETGMRSPSVFFFIYALGVISSRFVAGKSLDRKGPRWIIGICLSLLIIGFPMLALWHTQTGYYLSAIVLGIGNGVVFPSFQTMVNNMVDSSHRGAANSTIFIAVDIGMGLGMVLIGIIAQYFSLQTAFLFCSGICVLGLLLFFTVTLPHYSSHRIGI
ncbi:MAG: MFS transporter [Bacteroidales bacterium]|nr:MFS transporter [Bacteroidales bacterium]